MAVKQCGYLPTLQGVLSMARRILALLGDIVLRRRFTISTFGTIAGKLTAEKPVRVKIAGRIVLRYTPHYETIAGILTFQNSVIRTIAGRIKTFAKKRVTVGCKISLFIVEVIAGTLAFQYSNKETIGGIIKGHATKVFPVAGIAALCSRVVIASRILAKKTKASYIACVSILQKTEASPIACTVALQAPSWDQSMSGA